MDGTTSARLRGLLSHLAAHPVSIARYVRHLRSSPIALALPWFSWDAIDYLCGCDLNGKTIFEFGSGGSTLFFAARGASVVSVESDPLWLQAVEAELARKAIRNVKLLHRPLGAIDEFGSSGYLNLLDRLFDIVIVDCPEHPTVRERRRLAFARAEQFVRPGGMIVIDDAWRYDVPPLVNRATNRMQFKSPGPGRSGVTRTDIYFYGPGAPG